jgi:tetraacyldisaccharide 4'-kinase
MLRSKFLLWGQRLIENGAWFLAPLSWIWGFVALCKNSLYDRGWLPTSRINRPVVSVGNIVAGGTGKTPLVHLLASRFPHRNVAILSRGYGEMPDEPLLLQRRLPKAKVYIGENRVKLARRAMAEGAQLLILDDGFQYRKLHRDFDLVILSGADPFGKGHYLPRGFLRDSPKRLASADALFISGKGAFSFPHISLQVQVDQILDFSERPVATIRGWPVAFFCGIAKPAAFKKTIVDQGAHIVAEWTLADHEQADENALRSFVSKSKSLGARALICTEKDFIKLNPYIRCDLPVLFLEISFRVSEGQNEWENLIAKIDQKIDNITAYE